MSSCTAFNECCRKRLPIRRLRSCHEMPVWWAQAALNHISVAIISLCFRFLPDSAPATACTPVGDATGAAALDKDAAGAFFPANRSTAGAFTRGASMGPANGSGRPEGAASCRRCPCLLCDTAGLEGEREEAAEASSPTSSASAAPAATPASTAVEAPSGRDEAWARSIGPVCDVGL